MSIADDKICEHFHLLELNQSFVEVIDQQAPAVQQF